MTYEDSARGEGISMIYIMRIASNVYHPSRVLGVNAPWRSWSSTCYFVSREGKGGGCSGGCSSDITPWVDGLRENDIID